MKTERDQVGCELVREQLGQHPSDEGSPNSERTGDCELFRIDSFFGVCLSCCVTLLLVGHSWRHREISLKGGWGNDRISPNHQVTGARNKKRNEKRKEKHAHGTGPRPLYEDHPQCHKSRRHHRKMEILHKYRMCFRIVLFGGLVFVFYLYFFARLLNYCICFCQRDDQNQRFVLNQSKSESSVFMIIVTLKHSWINSKRFD